MLSPSIKGETQRVECVQLYTCVCACAVYVCTQKVIRRISDYCWKSVCENGYSGGFWGSELGRWGKRVERRLFLPCAVCLFHFVSWACFTYSGNYRNITIFFKRIQCPFIGNVLLKSCSVISSLFALHQISFCSWRALRNLCLPWNCTPVFPHWFFRLGRPGFH